MYISNKGTQQECTIALNGINISDAKSYTTVPCVLTSNLKGLDLTGNIW